MIRKDKLTAKRILSNRYTYLLLLVLSVVVLGQGLKSREPSLPRKDSHTPGAMVSDWGQPKRLGSPVNTPRPEDAIEISSDGKKLFFLYAKDLLENMTPAELLSRPNGTYVATRIGGPTDFSKPTFYNLGKGTSLSLDGELSFSPDGTKVYFHSNRGENKDASKILQKMTFWISTLQILLMVYLLQHATSDILSILYILMENMQFIRVGTRYILLHPDRVAWEETTYGCRDRMVHHGVTQLTVEIPSTRTRTNCSRLLHLMATPCTFHRIVILA